MDMIQIAEGIVAGKMELADFENETICMVDKNTDFKVIPWCHGGTFFGFNLYARPEGETNLTLLETYNSHNIARNVKRSITKGLAYGATYYRLPANE